MFIGSSIEGIDVAYAIQENLEFNADITIWDQGIFELTSTALDDLIKTLDNSDIGVFIFTPDDILKIRGSEYSSTRDNVIFELGLFLGYLGKERVSFVMPRDSKDFHLPSDLSGITPGYYTSNRKDNNLNAALGPYCNRLKRQIEKTAIIKLTSFKDDNQTIQKLVVNKPKNWEFCLTNEILRVEIKKLSRIIHEIKYDLYISQPVQYSQEDFFKFCLERGNLFKQLLEVFKRNMHLFVESFGELGKSGNEDKIKDTTLRMVSLGFKALEMEKQNKGVYVPEELSELKDLLSGWSNSITDSILTLHRKLDQQFGFGATPPENVDLNMEFTSPKNIEKMTEIVRAYTKELELLNKDN